MSHHTDGDHIFIIIINIMGYFLSLSHSIPAQAISSDLQTTWLLWQRVRPRRESIPELEDTGRHDNQNFMELGEIRNTAAS
jgi:hypothetical protein